MNKAEDDANAISPVSLSSLSFSTSVTLSLSLCLSKCLSVFLSSWHYTFDVQSIFYHCFPRGLDAKDMLQFNLYFGSIIGL